MSESVEIPQRKEHSEREIVSNLAEDVALDGWSVSGFTVKTDLEREEKTLSVSLHKSTAAGQQGVLELNAARKGRGKKASAEAPAAEAGKESDE